MNESVSRTVPDFRVTGSPHFTAWLQKTRASLAFSTYQVGKLFLIGLRPDGQLSIFERTFDRCMGLGFAAGQLWMSARFQLWRFENFLDPETLHENHDALFVPVAGHTTGEIDIHDIHAGADGRPIFVATAFNCLATLAERGSFKALWRPAFIDRVVGEDRCHLNGMAMEQDRPRFVSCVGRSNTADGWREHRRDGGVVIDMPSGEPVVTGLSMPHSPRLYRGKLWLLQSGTGEFGQVDPASGRFEPVCFLPGFARGLTFVGSHAIIGLSRPRRNRAFEGLALDERLARERKEPQSAICVVNLETGALEHTLQIEGIVEELYDVAVLPGIRRPMALGFRSDEIRFATRVEEGDLVSDLARNAAAKLPGAFS